MVPVVGVEPTRPCGLQILSLPRLPISPYRHLIRVIAENFPRAKGFFVLGDNFLFWHFIQ